MRLSKPGEKGRRVGPLEAGPLRAHRGAAPDGGPLWAATALLPCALSASGKSPGPSGSAAVRRSAAPVRLDGAVVSFTSRPRSTGGAATASESRTVFVVASVGLEGNSGLNLAATGCPLCATKTSGARLPRLLRE